MDLIERRYSWKNLSLSDFLKEGNIPSGWTDFFDIISEDLIQISDKLHTLGQEQIIYPEMENIFRVFYSIPLSQISVVFLGQDPYHDGNATGLCFDVPKDKKINPSLRNIYEELTYEGFKSPKQVCEWTKSGVFLINTALTVERSNPDSHTHIWYHFTKKLFQYISERRKDLVWILLGRNAHDYERDIEGYILKASHPSPFSYMKPSGPNPPFYQSGIFQETNRFLREMGNREIEW